MILLSCPWYVESERDQSGLYVWDPQTDSLKLMDRPDAGSPRGLCRVGDGYLWMAGAGIVRHYDRDVKYLRCYELQSYNNLYHDILLQNDQLYAVNTLSDSIERYSWPDVRPAGIMPLFGKFASKKDVCHVNTISAGPAGMLSTIFAPPLRYEDRAWQKMGPQLGAIILWQDKTWMTLMGGLKRPHTLKQMPSGLFFVASSMEQRAFILDPRGWFVVTELHFKESNFIRGMCPMGPNTLYVGDSAPLDGSRPYAQIYSWQEENLNRHVLPGIRYIYDMLEVI